MSKKRGLRLEEAVPHSVIPTEEIWAQIVLQWDHLVINETGISSLVIAAHEGEADREEAVGSDPIATLR